MSSALPIIGTPLQQVNTVEMSPTIHFLSAHLILCWQPSLSSIFLLHKFISVVVISWHPSHTCPQTFSSQIFHVSGFSCFFIPSYILFPFTLPYGFTCHASVFTPINLSYSHLQIQHASFIVLLFHRHSIIPSYPDFFPEELLVLQIFCWVSSSS